jgi:hypothetical protein
VRIHAGAKVVKEDNGLTHNRDNHRYHQGCPFSAPIASLSSHWHSPDNKNGASGLILPLKSSLSAMARADFEAA